ncbi:MAG: glycosyltransferase family 39 protein, partial [Candidatus Methanoperedens sp.]
VEVSSLKDVYPIGQSGSTYFVMPVLDGYLFKLFGEGRLIIQILRTTLFALTAVVAYYIGKELWDKRVGLIAGILLLSFPYFLSMSHLMLIDVPLAFFVTLSVFALIKARDSRKWFFILIPVLLLTLFTKKTGVVYLGFLVPVVLLALFIKYKWKILKIAAPVLAIIGFIAAIEFSGFLKWTVDSLLHGQSVAYMSHGMYWINPQYYLKSLPIVAGPIVTLLAFSSIILLLRRRDHRLLIPVAWMIIPIFIMVNPAFRHLIPAYPAYALAAAVVLVELEKGLNIGKRHFKLEGQSRRFFIASAVLLSISMALFVFPQIEATHMQVNVKEAAEYTNELEVRNISIVTIGDASFNWYGLEGDFRNMYDYYSTANVNHFPVQQFQDTNPDAIVVISTIINPFIPLPLNDTLRNYYLSKIFSKGDYEYFAPAIFSVYLPQIEYHSRYPEFVQKIGKGMKAEVFEVANPNAGLLNFVTWTPSDRKILEKNISVTWTIEAGEEPLEVGFYYRKQDGFIADKEGKEKIAKGSRVNITRFVEPSQTMGTFIRAVPFEADGKEIRIINVTFSSEFYNTSVSRGMKGFSF